MTALLALSRVQRTKKARETLASPRSVDPLGMGHLGGFRPSLVSATTCSGLFLCSGSAPRKEGPLSQATGTLSPLDRRQETSGLSEDSPPGRRLGCFSPAGTLGRHPQRGVSGWRCWSRTWMALHLLLIRVLPVWLHVLRVTQIPNTPTVNHTHQNALECKV